TYKDVTNNFKTARFSETMKIRCKAEAGRFDTDEEAIDRIVLAKCQKARQIAFSCIETGQLAQAAKILVERKTILEARINQGLIANIELLEREKKLIDEIVCGLQASKNCGKQIQAQIQDYLKKRGVYSGAFQEKKFIIKEVIAAKDKTEPRRVNDELKNALLDLGLNENFQNRCQICFSEALANAVEHGCKNDINGSIEITAVFRRDEARIQIVDSGSGFDCRKLMENASKHPISERAGNPDEVKTRGRGIPLLLHYADQVLYNDQGNEILLTIKNRLPTGVITFDSQSLSGNDQKSDFNCNFEFKNHQVSGKEIVEIIVRGSLDMWNAAPRKAIIDMLRQNGVDSFILNINDVDYIDSSGLSFFILLLKLDQQSVGRKIIVNSNDHIYSILSLIGIDHLFIFAENTRAALQMF
ncbi:MAG: ATP-binding protein, partial [Candidatus Riflebacteria bacterium]